MIHGVLKEDYEEHDLDTTEEANLDDIDILMQDCSGCENAMLLDDTDDFLMCVKDIDNPKKVSSEYICFDYEGKIYRY